jgi:predicted O-methyltransferase YrrM
MNLVMLFFRYLKFYWKAYNAHGLHSPFVYQLYTEVIAADKFYHAFQEIDFIRRQLLKDTQTLEVEDLGAGSKVFKSKKRKVKDIAKYSVSKAKIGQLLFKLVDRFAPDTIFELGTSLGISTLYLALAAKKNAKIYTFEGCQEIAKVAKTNFENTQIPIEICIGNLDKTLPEKLKSIEKLDFVFFDANHQYEATMSYFTNCLPKIHNETVFVFDDIHWSEEMHKAWKEICQNPKVRLSLDLFYIGIVFFREEQHEKEHFLLRF